MNEQDGTPPVTLDGENRPSAVELLKEQSNYLRGTIAEELDSGTDHFESDASQLLKHHGTYQQDDRDQRTALRGTADGKAYMMMVRTKIPGGRLTSDQLLAEIDLCDSLGNQTLRITTRQGLQLHGVLKSNLAATIRRINEVQLTTLGACGDVNRNVMCCPAPIPDPVREEMHHLAIRIADHFAPRSGAYHEIWLQEFSGGELQGEKIQVIGGVHDPREPIYGRHYLPRKFKMGIALPEDNCIDVYTHDVGLLAVREDHRLSGYNVLVGGGMGVTPSAKKTFPALAKPLCFATPAEVFDVISAVVAVQRDHGNRCDRKVARLKYLVANWGIERFREEVAGVAGRKLNTPRQLEITGHDDHLGWMEQEHGRWCYGLNVENGRIRDTESMRLKSALRVICSQLRPGIRLTAHQSILFTDIGDGDRATLESVLRNNGVPLSHEISQVRRWSMACVAWPTCGLSITEAERALPGMIDRVEVELARLGLADEAFTVRMTGCPNGCARPYNPDIGLVGKAKGRYTIFVGGRRLGDRLNFLYRDMVQEEDVVAELTAIMTIYRDQRLPGESLGDCCDRLGKDSLTVLRERYYGRND